MSMHEGDPDRNGLYKGANHYEYLGEVVLDASKDPWRPDPVSVGVQNGADLRPHANLLSQPGEFDRATTEVADYLLDLAGPQGQVMCGKLGSANYGTYLIRDGKLHEGPLGDRPFEDVYTPQDLTTQLSDLAKTPNLVKHGAVLVTIPDAGSSYFCVSYGLPGFSDHVGRPTNASFTLRLPMGDMQQALTDMFEALHEYPNLMQAVWKRSEMHGLAKNRDPRYRDCKLDDVGLVAILDPRLSPFGLSNWDGKGLAPWLGPMSQVGPVPGGGAIYPRVQELGYRHQTKSGLDYMVMSSEPGRTSDTQAIVSALPGAFRAATSQ